MSQPNGLCSNNRQPIDAAPQEHWRDLDFPSRKLRRRPTPADLAEFRTKKADLRRNAATQEQLNPVSFSLENSWSF